MLKIKQDSTLLFMNKDQPLNVTLEKVKIDAIIHSLTADVTLTQIFRNDKSTSIEAVYYFPVKIQADYKFTVYIDGREIVTQPRKILDEDSYVIDIGCLGPSKECIITVIYVTKLNYVHESLIQFVVPSNTNSEYLQINPYTLEFTCRIEDINELKHQQRIVHVSSTSHPIQVQYTKQNSYIITFNQKNTHLNEDISINIQLSDSIEKNDQQVQTTQCVFHSNDINSSINILTRNSIGQPFDYYCVLDFEAVCHQVNPRLTRPAPNDIWEIIEFPICLLESESNTIIDIYHSYVRPTIKSTLNEKCIEITGITQDIIDNSPVFGIVWKDVQTFLAKHLLIPYENNPSNLYSFTWIICGNWDLKTMLPLQLKQSGLDRPRFINNFINLKDLYNEYYPTARIRGMKDMLQKSNLKLEGRHHSGLDDTKNIARIAQWFIQNNKKLKLTKKETL